MKGNCDNWRLTQRLMSAGIVAAALALGGCALSGALNRGHAHVDQGNYRAALVAYDRALNIDPNSVEARRLRNQIAPYAVKEASADARSEMAAGRYEQAFEHARYVERLDGSAARQLHADNSTLMHAGAQGLFGKGQHEGSYALSARMRDLYPQHNAVGGLLEQARQHYFARSEQHVSAGQFEDGLAALAIVERYEPALRGEVQQRQARLKGTWAARVASTADKHLKADRRGAAAALYARAYAIGRNSKHLELMRANVRELRKDGRFVLGVHGDKSERSTALVDELNEQARNIEGLTLPTHGDDGVSLIAAVAEARSSCSQDTQLEQGAQQYVSGYRQVPNPSYERAGQDVSQLQSSVDRHDQKLEQVRARAERSRLDAQRCQTSRLGPAETSLTRKQADADRRRKELDRMRDKERRLQKRLARTPPGPRGQSQRDRIEERLAKLRKRMRDKRQELKRYMREVKRVRRKRDDAARQCNTHRDKMERAQRDARDVQNDRDHDADKLGQAQSALATTPATLTVEELDTFRYPIKQIQRRCTVSAELTLQAAWTNSTERERLGGAHQTTDRSHQGYPKYGVVRDPLRFAMSDGELVRVADERAAESGVDAIAERARAYYDHMVSRALDMAHQDAHGATDLMLSMMLAAPGQVRDEHKAAAAKHLKEHYQLSDWRSLTK